MSRFTRSTGGRHVAPQGRRALAVLTLAALSALAVVVPTSAPQSADAVQSPTSCNATVALDNGGFEQPVIPANSFRILPQAQVPGWSTTAPDGGIEIWRVPFNGVPAASGSQFAELNANVASTLFQDLATTPGQTLRWGLAHRGRSGVDTMRVLIGPPGGVLAGQGNISDGNTAWGTYSGLYTVPAGQTTTRFGFEAVSSAGGNASFGNFLDSISFGTGACIVTTETVTNTTGASTANIGDVLTYTVTATSGGGIPAELAVMSDQLPPGVTFIPGSIRAIQSATTAARTDAAGDDQGEYDSGTNTVRVRVGTGATATAGGRIEPGELRSFSYQVRVNSASAGSTITDDATTVFTDPLSTRLTSVSNPAVIQVNPAADLAVTQSQLTPTLTAGQPFSYTATVTNNGPDTEPSAVLVTRLTSGGQSALAASGVTAATTGGTCVVTATEITCTYSSLALGQSRTVTVSGTAPVDVPAGSQFTLSSVASGAIFDPVAINNSASLSDSMTASADLSIDVATATTSPTAGSNITYTATVANAGPSTARDIVITNPVATGDTFVSASVPGGTCSYVSANRTVECIVPDLDPAETAVATIIVQLDPAGTGVATDSATVQSSTADPSAANNTDQVAVNATASADVAVTLSIASSTARPGDTVGFTLTVTNNGPSVAQNVSFNNVVPPGFTVVRPASPICTPSACTIPSLAVGQVVTITGTVIVGADAEEGPGQASTTVTSSTPDAVSSNNSATVPFTIELSADLQISQTITNFDTPGSPIVAGGRVQSVITVENLGPTRAEGLVQRQTYSAGQAIPTVTTNRGACVFQGALVDGIAVDGGVLECTLDVLDAPGPDDTWTITLLTVVRSTFAETSITRERSVSSASPDPVPANNSTSTTVAVVRVSDIQVTQTTSTPAVIQTGEVRFQVTVTNNGPSDARDLLIREEPQPGMVITSATPSSGTYAESSGNWSIPYLAVGDSVTLDLVGTAEASGTVENAASSISSGSTDPNAANDRASTTVNVTPASESLAISTTAIVSPSANQTALRVGDTIAYSYVATNTGNVAMATVTVTDALVGAASCPLASLDPGQSMTCFSTTSYLVTQDDFDLGDSIRNNATVSGDPTGPTGVTAFGPAVASVDFAAAAPSLIALLIADFNDTDSDGAIDVGETIGYTVRIVNTGDISVTGVTAADVLGTSYTCPVTSLAPGEAVNCTAAPYVITALDVTAGDVDNTATGSGQNGRGGPRTVSGPSSTTTPTTPAPALQIVTSGIVTPAANQAAAASGDTIAWTYSVTNTGNVSVTALDITDPQGGVIVCAATSLEPGQSTTCTGDAVYTVAEADVLAGAVSNGAVATATPVTGGARVASAESVGSVTVEPVRAALEITPTVVNVSSPGVTPEPGDELSGVYIVRNVGNVTVNNVSVTDPLFGAFTCAVTVLAPGEQTTCESVSTRVVTAADVTAGEVDAEPVASADPPTGSGVAGVFAVNTLVVFVQAAPVVVVPPTAPAPPATSPSRGGVRGGGALADTGTDGAAPFGWALLLLLTGASAFLGSRSRRVRSSGSR